MRLNWRMFVVVAFGVGLLCIGTALVMRNLENSRKKKAEQLLIDTRVLTPGESSTEDILLVVNKFDGQRTEARSSSCPAADAAFEARVSSLAQELRILGHATLASVGFHVWGATSTFWLEKGRLCSSRFGVGTLGSGEAANATLDLTVTMIAQARQGSPESDFDVHTNSLRGTRSLLINMTNAASSDQRSRGYDLDLTCLTKFRGCRDMRDLAPRTWDEALGPK